MLAGTPVGPVASAMHRLPATFALLAFLSSPAAAQEPGAGAIDSMALRAHTYLLAHDLLEGRGTGTRGGEIAALYLATSAARLGLQPVAGAGFYEDVPLVEADIDTVSTTLSLTDSSGTSVFRTPVGFIPNVGTAATLVSFGGELAWVGRAADLLAHPDRLPDLRGRVAIMAGVFGADGAAADTLRARGATGVIHFVGDEATYRLYVDSRGPSRMYVADASVRSSFIPPIPSVIARPDLIRRLMPAAASDDQLDRPFLVTGKAGHRVGADAAPPNTRA